LSIIPQGGHGVTVKVTHDVSGVTDQESIRAGAGANGLHEQVHSTSVKSILLVAILVILIARRSLRAAEAERIDQVRIVRQQSTAEAVDRRCAATRMKLRLARRVQRHWVRGKVMVERNILLKDHNYVLDGSRRRVL